MLIKRFINSLVIGLFQVAGLFVVSAWSNPLEYLNTYNVVWDSPSKNASESMPVGGHSMGLNVWVEDGDVLFYAQRSGSFTENNEYHKLGRVRLTLNPNPFVDGAEFRQELKLQQGHVEIQGQHAGQQVTVKVWCEADRAVVHLDVESSEEVSAVVAYEGWRNDVTELAAGRLGMRFGCFSWDCYPGQVYSYPDVVAHRGNGVLFYHRNRDDQLLIDYAVNQQGLEAVKDQVVNTQKGRTFGGYLTGTGFVEAGQGQGIYQNTAFQSWKLRSDQSRKTHAIKLYTNVEQTETLDEWTTNLFKLITDRVSDTTAYATTLEWWDAFWNRSWLMINSAVPDPKSRSWQLGRNYQLFRYQLGCNFYGEYPTKFNGGNFTYDPKLVSSKKPYSPDWRAWGGGSFTAQNQRLLYWPMLKTGDYEGMLPQFEFYRRMLATGKARVQTYWGHEGLLFCEQTENFGLPIACAWGWSEPDAKDRIRSQDTELGILDNQYISYHYESQLEFSYMILEYQRHTGADISAYMDLIEESVRFFDAHYQMRYQKTSGQPLDTNGKLVIFPSTACETYKMAKNPVDLISGLHACIDGLLRLDGAYLNVDKRAYYRAYQQRIPEYTYDEVDGDPIIKPAAAWQAVRNVECPQFYPLFPFNQFALGQDDLTVFRNTWKHGTFPKGMVKSWHQDGIFFARMGMTEAAKAFNTLKMQDAKGRRFPTFWGPGHDWVPDHNWGGSGMIGIQEMLMQTVGDQIYLLPAWPKDWDVAFKLHAPQQTTVEGEVRNGEIIDLVVTPAERMQDVVIATDR